MAYLGFAAFVAVVALLAWYSQRHQQRMTSCCAPPDPRDDLRMRAAFDDGPDERREGHRGA
jgi:hypothetical protein